MQTDLICQRDAYAKTIEATVLRVDPSDEGLLVEIDRTVFYPGGGGQPADTGWLRAAATGIAAARWSVTGTRRSGDTLWHVLGESAEGMASGQDSPRPAEGDTVFAEIDWQRRHLLMRTHTALHALCGVVWRDHAAQVTGSNMEPGQGRLDFEFERMSGELVGEIENRLNAELAAERDVRVDVLPREEAFAIPDLIRTKVNLLPQGIEEVRIVEIMGLDLQADGGTHVANTREVGPVNVTGYESKGRINKRIRIALAAE